MKKAEVQTLLNRTRFYKQIIIYKESIFVILLFGLLLPMQVQAQGPLCPGSTSVPVVLETFGAGTNPGPKLLAGVTTYTYTTTWPSDGTYTIWNTTNPNNQGDPYWYTNADHTGDPNGYMMVVNASTIKGEFYRKKVTGLCPNTTYIFSAFAANVNTDSVLSYCGKPPAYKFPNIIFKITSPSGVVLGADTTGDIPISKNGFVWTEYGFSFSSQSQSSVDIVMVNQGPGGCGNDLVIDDISFYICSPKLIPQTNPSKQAYCKGENVTILGGLGPGYTNPQFQWQFSADGGTTWNDISGETKQDIILNNLAILSPAGQYRLMVAENGNIGSSTCRIISPAVVVTVVAHPTSSIVTNNVSCFGGNNGNANVNPSGGTQPYTYLWSTTPVSTTQNISGLLPGTYSVTIKDTYGCLNTNSATITQPVTGLVIAASSQTNVSCNGGNNGNANVSASGGTPNYTYLWNNGQTTTTATGLIIGNYSVLVTDANGCTNSNTFTITQPTLLVSTPSQTNVLCNGGNGSASVLTTGGNPAYTYNWNNGKTTSAITIPAGNYSVSITDANGCTNSNTFTITQPTLLVSTPSQTNVLCNGGNGSASVLTTGGTPAYTYKWSNGQTTSAITGIIAGSYSVLVTDANGCTNSNTFTLTQPTILASTISQTNILCNGGNNGSASVNVSGGTPNYTYLWSNGGTTSAITGITAGNYSVLVTDANTICSATRTFVITQPTYSLSLSLSGKDSICPSEKTILNATATGGTPAYTYLWMPGSFSGTSISVSPAATTTYTATATDANGCSSDTKRFSVTVLPDPTALFDTAASGFYISAFSFKDLSSGGTSWLWNFGDGTSSTEQNPTHLFPSAGIYTVTQVVYTEFGCPDSFSMLVGGHEKILIPNVFTPDGDNVNDYWYIPNSGMEEFHVEIFDRWGLKLFETTDDKIKWDGKTNSGKELSGGTYFFVLKATMKSVNGIKDYSANGNVTLIRQK